MPIFLLKTILAVILLIPVGIAVFTMFEVLGRVEKRYDAERLKRIHRINGMAYLLLYLLIAGLCLYIIARTQADLGPRSTFHAVFALTIFVLLLIKISFVRFYRHFYNRIATVGMSLVILTVLMFGTSGGFFLLITDFGTDTENFRRTYGHHDAETEQDSASWNPSDIEIRTDGQSIQRGQALYEEKCLSCHDPKSRKMLIGPGHKEILHTDKLPASGRPATVENVAAQLKDPYGSMPSFSSLSKEQVEDLIAYMQTL
jgi:cytochrome c1